MEIHLKGVGVVTIEQLEARMSAYLNAGAPKPVIEGSRDERIAILNFLAERGDSQMKALVELLNEK